ncbi:MAG TPA: hypothetical protein VEC36_10385, partial [Patescibacteria group bacterium]|nr:hypothetical protein [Patescibacteria group bacterium]
GSDRKVEPVAESSVVLTTDNDVFLNNDTIKAGENIYQRVANYDKRMILFKSFEEGQFERFTILKFNKIDTSRLILNEGYYTFYISAETENKHTLKDSALVYYSK